MHGTWKLTLILKIGFMYTYTERIKLTEQPSFPLYIYVKLSRIAYISFIRVLQIWLLHTLVPLKLLFLPSNTVLASPWYIYIYMKLSFYWQMEKPIPNEERRAQPNKDRRPNITGWRLENQSQRTRNEKHFHLTQKNQEQWSNHDIYQTNLAKCYRLCFVLYCWPFVCFVSTSNYLSN